MPFLFHVTVMYLRDELKFHRVSLVRINCDTCGIEIYGCGVTVVYLSLCQLFVYWLHHRRVHDTGPSAIVVSAHTLPVERTRVLSA